MCSLPPTSCSLEPSTAGVPSIKSIPAVRVLALRQVVESYRAQKDLWPQVLAAAETIGARIAGPCFTIYYDLGYKPKDVDMEVCLQIPQDASVDQSKLPENIKLRDLPEESRVAFIVHEGSYTNLPTTYEKFFGWIKDEKIQPAGPVREVYLKMDPEDKTEKSFLTEIQQIIA